MPTITVEQQYERAVSMADALRLVRDVIPDPAAIRFDLVVGEIEVQLLQASPARVELLADDLGLPAGSRRSRFRGRDIVYTWRGVVGGFFLLLTLTGLGAANRREDGLEWCSECRREHPVGVHTPPLHPTERTAR